MAPHIALRWCYFHLLAWICITVVELPTFVECKKQKKDKQSKKKEVKLPAHLSTIELQTFKVDASEVRSVSFSPDGLMAVTGHYDHVAKVWFVANSSLVRFFVGHAGVVLSATFSPDGLKILTSSSDNTAKYWEVRTGKELMTLRGHTGWVVSAAFAPSGKTALTTSNDGTARLWDLDFGETERVYSDRTNPTSAMLSAAFSGDGNKIILGTESNSTLLFDFYNSQPKCEADQAPSAGIEAIVCIETARPLSLFLHTAWVVALAACPDGSAVVSGSHDGTAVVWNATTGVRLQTLGGHGGSVSTVACSPDGRNILTGSRGGDIHVWDIATGAELLMLDSQKQKRKDRRRFKGGLPPAGFSLVSLQFMPLGKTAVVGYLVPAPPKPIPQDPRRAKCEADCAARGNPPDEPLFEL